MGLPSGVWNLGMGYELARSGACVKTSPGMENLICHRLVISACSAKPLKDKMKSHWPLVVPCLSILSARVIICQTV